VGFCFKFAPIYLPFHSCLSIDLITFGKYTLLNKSVYGVGVSTGVGVGFIIGNGLVGIALIHSPVCSLYPGQTVAVGVLVGVFVGALVGVAVSVEVAVSLAVFVSFVISSIYLSIPFLYLPIFLSLGVVCGLMLWCCMLLAW
jgi:hypothetical protein